MKALTLFFAVFWSGEKKFSRIVIRSREDSLEAQTRVSVDFRDNKELWNLVIQDYIKSSATEAEKNAYVREQVRLLLGGTQKKRYEKLLEKMSNVGLEIEEDIYGFGRKYFSFVVNVEPNTRTIESQYQLLERDGKFVGYVSCPGVPSEVVEVLEKVVKSFQEQQILERVKFDFVYLPASLGQEERAVVLGSEQFLPSQTVWEEKIAQVGKGELSGGKLVLNDAVGGSLKNLAYLLDLETPVRNEMSTPSHLRDLTYTPENSRGIVFSGEDVKYVVPEQAMLFLATGDDEQKAQEAVVLLYEQALGLMRDLKAREKLAQLR